MSSTYRTDGARNRFVHLPEAYASGYKYETPMVFCKYVFYKMRNEFSPTNYNAQGTDVSISKTDDVIVNIKEMIDKYLQRTNLKCMQDRWNAVYFNNKFRQERYICNRERELSEVGKPRMVLAP